MAVKAQYWQSGLRQSFQYWAFTAIFDQMNHKKVFKSVAKQHF
jgi:hypothetical protein